MLEYFEYFGSFFGDVWYGLYDFILENKIIFDFVFLGIGLSVVLLVIDFIFDIRDEFGDFYKFRDEPFTRYKYRYGRNKNNQERFDIYSLYRQNVDYNHEKKMEQLHYYRESENLRHEHKHEEFDMFNKIKTNIRQEKAKKPKPNLDIEYEED